MTIVIQFIANVAFIFFCFTISLIFIERLIFFIRTKRLKRHIERNISRRLRRKYIYLGYRLALDVLQREQIYGLDNSHTYTVKDLEGILGFYSNEFGAMYNRHIKNIMRVLKNEKNRKNWRLNDWAVRSSQRREKT